MLCVSIFISEINFDIFGYIDFITYSHVTKGVNSAMRMVCR